MVMWWRCYTKESNGVAVQKQDISTGSAGIKEGNAAAVMKSAGTMMNNGSLIMREAGVATENTDMTQENAAVVEVEVKWQGKILKVPWRKLV